MTPPIQTVDELASLLARPLRRPRPERRLLLRIEGLSEAEARRWETRLARDYLACGCELASVVMLLALAGYVVSLALAPGGLAAAGWHDLLVGAIVGFTAAASGKTIGLLHARWRLRRSIRTLTTQLSAHDPPPTSTPTATAQPSH